jgi:hypothetical protein
MTPSVGGVGSPSVPTFVCVLFCITAAPKLLPLEKVLNEMVRVPETHMPWLHARPDAHTTPWHATSVQTPPTHAEPGAHGVPLHEVSWQVPFTQTWPEGHVVPTHGFDVHVVPSTQTWSLLQFALPQSSG